MRLVLAIAIMMVCLPANASDKSEWFESLKVPFSNGLSSCCSDADCKKTIAEFRNGHWYAAVPNQNGKMIEVPDYNIVKHPTSYDGEAYVCTMYDGDEGDYLIRCFVPPWTIF